MVSIVIFDEFHERDANTDTTFALCHEYQIQLRPKLRTIVMPATLSGGKTDNNNDDDDQDNKNNDNSFNKLLNAMGREKECNIVHSEGRQ